MRPPVRPPQLRCVFFSSMYLPHLLVLPATFWTSVPFATLSVFPSLICGSCPSGQRFAYSFFQIPSHGGHPCCSAMCFVVAYAHLGLSPIRKRPCWANKNNRMHALRAFYCLRFRLRNLYAVCIHIIGVLPDQLGDGNWLIALILQIVDQVGKRLCGINSSGMEQEDRAVLELATV